MRGLVAPGLLVLLLAGNGAAQVQPLPAGTGRELLAAADPLGAAKAFQASLREGNLTRFTVQLAIFCDVSNLERQVRASGNPPELFVLRRAVGERPCLGLYWGLFASRDEAREAVSGVPVVLRAAGQAPVAVYAILPPGEPATPLVAAASRTAAAPPTRPPAASPPPAAADAPEPVPTPPARVAPPPPMVESPVTSGAIPEAPSAPVPTIELAAGYSYLHDDAFPLTGGSFAAGWILSACANLDHGLGIVGEVSAQYKTVDVLGQPPFLNLGILGIHAGLRYARHLGPATPYVQGLAGLTRSSVEETGVRRVEDDFSLQPGAGVAFRLSERLALGLGGDYRLVFGEIDERNEFRFHAALVFGIGRR